MWSSGAGSDVMKRIAAPLVGGVVTSVLEEMRCILKALSLLQQMGVYEEQKLSTMTSQYLIS